MQFRIVEHTSITGENTYTVERKSIFRWRTETEFLSSDFYDYYNDGPLKQDRQFDTAEAAETWIQEKVASMKMPTSRVVKTLSFPFPLVE